MSNRKPKLYIFGTTMFLVVTAFSLSGFIYAHKLFENLSFRYLVASMNYVNACPIDSCIPEPGSLRYKDFDLANQYLTMANRLRFDSQSALRLTGIIDGINGQDKESLSGLMLALSESTECSYWVPYTLLIAERAYEIEDFIDIFVQYQACFSTQLRKRFQPTAVAFYIEQASQNENIVEQTTLIKSALDVWPHNLCAMAFSVNHELPNSSDLIERISSRQFDGSFALSSHYLKCLSAQLSSIIETNPQLVQEIERIFLQLIWSGVPDTVLDAVALINERKLDNPGWKYQIKGTAHLADGDIDNSLMAFERALEVNTNPRSVVLLSEVQQRLKAISNADILPSMYASVLGSDLNYHGALWASSSILTQEETELLSESIHEAFSNPNLMIELNSDWVLRAIHIDEKQLSIQHGFSAWFLLEATRTSSAPNQKWIQLSQDLWAAHLLVENLVPNAGFEQGTGLGNQLPYGYNAHPEAQRQVYLVQRTDTLEVNQVVELHTEGFPSIGITSDIFALRPGHYLFMGSMKSDISGQDMRSGVVYCQLLDEKQRYINIQRLISGAAPPDWREFIRIFEVPSDVHWCELNLTVNQSGHVVQYDDLMIVNLDELFISDAQPR